MPPALAAATAIGTALGFVGTMATIVGAVLVIGTFALIARSMKKKQEEQAAAMRGILLTKEGSSESIPVVYGQRRVGVHKSFIASNGDKNKYLHLIYTLCEGPIEGATTIYFNDEVAATSSNNGASWTWESKYSGYAHVEFYDGSQTTACTNLVNESVGWPSTAVGNKVAYMYMKLTYDDSNGAFESGLPTVTVRVKGRTMPNIGSAQGTTESYQTDPAHCLYDYLTNDLYGKGIPHTLLDTTSFWDGKTYCNETVTNSDSSTGVRYSMSAYVDTNQSLLDNIQSLLMTCRGGLITGDQYKLLLDKPESTGGAIAINDDNIVGDISYLQANKQTLLNSLRATFPNENADFNYQEDIMIIESPTLQGSGYDGLTLSTDVTLQHVTNELIVERILTEEINQSRQSGVLQLTVSPQLLALAVGDIVKVTNDTLGQTNKFYRIIGTELKYNHEIELTMREYDANVYWDNNTGIITNNKDDTDH